MPHRRLQIGVSRTDGRRAIVSYARARELGRKPGAMGLAGPERLLSRVGLIP